MGVATTVRSPRGEALRGGFEARWVEPAGANASEFEINSRVTRQSRSASGLGDAGCRHESLAIADAVPECCTAKLRIVGVRDAFLALWSHQHELAVMPDFVDDPVFLHGVVVVVASCRRMD